MSRFLSQACSEVDVAQLQTCKGRGWDVESSLRYDLRSSLRWSQHVQNVVVARRLASAGNSFKSWREARVRGVVRLWIRREARLHPVSLPGPLRARSVLG